MNTDKEPMFRLTPSQIADLKALIKACGANRNDQARVLIEACIDLGCNTKPQIMGFAKFLGLNTRHVAKVLDDGTGPSPHRYHWYQRADGAYAPHGELATADSGE